MNAYTHAGLFHADEVFAWAALKMAGFNGYSLKRVTKVPDDINSYDIVFDIGGGKFDHHQKDAEVRENKVPYAAFGLVVREFHKQMGLSDDEYKLLDNTYIQQLDGYDNGYFENSTLSNAISAFYPVWDADNGPEAQMKAFEEAVTFAEVVLRKEIASVKAKSRARKIAMDAKNTVFYHTVFLEKFAPVAGNYINDENIHWIAFPSNRGGWNISSVPGVNIRNKALMPEEFRGKSGNDLPTGMTFCHPSGFIAGFNSEQDARDFAEKYL